MKKTKKKLVLSKETVRSLDLAAVSGGDTSYDPTDPTSELSCGMRCMPYITQTCPD